MTEEEVKKSQKRALYALLFGLILGMFLWFNNYREQGHKPEPTDKYLYDKNGKPKPGVGLWA